MWKAISCACNKFGFTQTLFFKHVQLIRKRLFRKETTSMYIGRVKENIAPKLEWVQLGVCCLFLRDPEGCVRQDSSPLKKSHVRDDGTHTHPETGRLISIRRQKFRVE